jgi:hypothetical protein
MLEESSERGIERAITGPESRKWQDTLPSELLHESSLRKDDAEHVTESRQGDEDGEGALCLSSKDVAEEGGSDKALGRYNLVGRNRGEVCDLG